MENNAIERLEQIKARTAGHIEDRWEVFQYSNHEVPMSFAMLKIGDVAVNLGEYNQLIQTARLIAAAPDLLDIATDLAEEVTRLRDLVSAVNCSAFEICCEDVDGVNWFDARAALTSQENTNDG